MSGNWTTHGPGDGPIETDGVHLKPRSICVLDDGFDDSVFDFAAMQVDPDLVTDFEFALVDAMSIRVVPA